MTDIDFLNKAIDISHESVLIGGFPVGAIVVLDNEIIGTGVSNGKNIFDATGHAEITAIREASKKLSKRDLKNCIVYSSLEPCVMCFSASFWAGITKVVYACSKDKAGIKHFEGSTDLVEINKNNRRQIEIVHINELEEKAFSIISDWEKSINI